MSEPTRLLYRRLIFKVRILSKSLKMTRSCLVGQEIIRLEQNTNNPYTADGLPSNARWKKIFFRITPISQFQKEKTTNYQLLCRRITGEISSTKYSFKITKVLSGLVSPDQSAERGILVLSTLPCDCLGFQR